MRSPCLCNFANFEPVNSLWVTRWWRWWCMKERQAYSTLIYWSKLLQKTAVVFKWWQLERSNNWNDRVLSSERALNLDIKVIFRSWPILYQRISEASARNIVEPAVLLWMRWRLLIQLYYNFHNCGWQPLNKTSKSSYNCCPNWLFFCLSQISQLRAWMDLG